MYNTSEKKRIKRFGMLFAFFIFIYIINIIIIILHIIGGKTTAIIRSCSMYTKYNYNIAFYLEGYFNNNYILL